MCSFSAKLYLTSKGIVVPNCSFFKFPLEQNKRQTLPVDVIILVWHPLTCDAGLSTSLTEFCSNMETAKFASFSRSLFCRFPARIVLRFIFLQNSSWIPYFENLSRNPGGLFPEMCAAISFTNSSEASSRNPPGDFFFPRTPIGISQRTCSETSRRFFRNYCWKFP